MTLDGVSAKRELMGDRISTFAAAVTIVLTCAGSIAAQVAEDDFENTNPDYADGFDYGDNGGIGFDGLTYLGGANGGLFEGAIDGQALGIFAGNDDGQAVGRAINSPIFAGTYTLSLSFNLSNATDFSGFNLKNSIGGSLGAGELLFVGLTASNGNASLLIGDGTGGHSVSLGADPDLRFENIDFSISFDTGALTYSLTATVRDSGDVGMFSGTLKDTNGGDAGSGAVGAVGFGNFDAGSNNNLLVDNLNLTAIPEPSTVSLLSTVAIFGGCFYARRRRA